MILKTINGFDLDFDPDQHRYTYQGAVVPSVTQILFEEGFTDAQWFTEKASALGRAVHLACHFLDEGTLDWESLDVEIMPYVEGYVAFRNMTGFAHDFSEQPIYHPTYGYAGTPDKLGALNGGKILLDLKTCRPSPATGLQLAGYAEPIDASLPRYALELGSTAGTLKWKLRPFTDTSDRAIFLGAVANRAWKQIHLRRTA